MDSSKSMTWVAPNGDHTLLMLVSGLLVLARVVERNEKMLVVYKPLRVEWNIAQHPNGQQQIAVNIIDLVPQFAVMMGGKDQLPIPVDHITFELEPKKEIVAAYVQQTSGIQLAMPGSERTVAEQHRHLGK